MFEYDIQVYDLARSGEHLLSKFSVDGSCHPHLEILAEVKRRYPKAAYYFNYQRRQ